MPIIEATIATIVFLLISMPAIMAIGLCAVITWNLIEWIFGTPPTTPKFPRVDEDKKDE